VPTLPLILTEDPHRALRGALFGALGVGLLALAALAALDLPRLMPLVPLAAVTPVVLVFVAGRPEWALAMVTGLFIMASGNDPGVGVPELIFGGFYIPYLVGWYALRILVYREPLVQQRGDVAMLALFGVVALGAAMGLVTGNRPGQIISEAASFSLLGFYFPVREFCVRHRGGVVWVLGLIVAAGLVAVTRNILNFTDVVASAIDLRGVAAGRVADNEVIIYVATVAAASGTLFLRGWRGQALGFVCFLLCFTGLVLTQFRAYYLAFGLAAGVAFLLLDGGRRRRLVGAVLLALVGIVGVAAVLVGDLLMVFVVGVIDRMLTIGSASTQDLSLLNRFLEYERAWELIWQSPVVGHGIGAEFGFYDAVYSATWVKGFIHNAYLQLWYKLGAVGLGVFLYLCALTAVRGFRAHRRAPADQDRAAGLFLLAMLCGLALAALVTVLFNTDTTFPLALCFGVGAAIAQRTPAPRAGTPLAGVGARD